MYDDILLPTDGSAGMEAVIDHAGRLAAEHGARVHALYVVDTASLSDLPVEGGFDGVSRQLNTEGERALDDVDDRLEVPVERTLTDGSPAREIVAYATEEGCDVVVMGTHGRTGVDRLILGSVAERVVRSSPVPVLTVRVSPD
ncbi:universal stress protein [Salinirussus salinus]|jgi:nucleotide-binding universal stress UspA family protein|uniref:universal stress protein n=1 Tax=Salinirussus salinus TaxID=1198300 RepID=UPI00135CC938|nr:universal stress protein [Salinirussus salinus]